MPGIDSSIYFQQKPVDFIGSYERGMNMRQMADERALRQKTLQDDKDLKDAMRAGIIQKPDGTLDINADTTFARMAQVNPIKAYEFKQENEAKMLSQNKAKIEGQLQKLDLGSRILSGVSDQESFDKAMETGQKFGMDVSAFGKYYDPDLVKQYQAMSVSAKDKLAEQYKAYDFGLRQSALGLRDQELQMRGRELQQNRIDKQQKNAEMSVSEAKQAGLYNLGLEAEKQYQEAVKDKSKYDPTKVGQVIDNSQWAPNWTKNDQAIAAQAAQANWVEAFLRDDSGAAIPPSERLAYAKDFFAQSGDTDEVVANKDRLRQIKQENARVAAGGDRTLGKEKNKDSSETKEYQGNIYKRVGNNWVKQ